MYIPDHEKIFEDLNYTEACESVSCRWIGYNPKNSVSYCGASCAIECPRVSVIADEVRQFIGDNDDAFMYIMKIGE